MSAFPQIGVGSIAQFPLSRSRRWRSIMNELESGERIMLPDTAASRIEWRLSYRDLTYTEATDLSALFTASQGSFGAFTFIDPLANLLGWSEDLSQANWEAGLLQRAGGVADPLGTQRAWSVANPSAGTQAFQQTVGMPGSYVACFSAYLRADAVGVVTLGRDGTATAVELSPAWQRFSIKAQGVSGATQATFSIALASGQTVDVFGLQVEAQPYPGAYKQTTTAQGIYEETYFENDELKITSTSVGLSSCEISLMSRV